ncbi:transcriptional antiterminator, Rof [Andreprevotia lacus DSM 23236]|jgi:Rho-binding antiterminator|uniref:Transcriptional antiterminator, Rof n=1 Tax=Andreprevotia lacus DSM 23236 TaxID=1121001 RepID=A0A1W1XZK0_9NEIS|nr:Rho-binding antiterminator [Andreprevotia lacus]SMC29346.1 transcriptional antiterminator, Rof [Andreprevotia lacus DSM 23236]
MTHKPYQPIDSDLYDYLELACTNHYKLHVERVGAPEVDGHAKTLFDRDQTEYLQLETHEGLVDVRLDDLNAITPRDRGALFGRIVYR